MLLYSRNTRMMKRVWCAFIICKLDSGSIEGWYYADPWINRRCRNRFYHHQRPQWNSKNEPPTRSYDSRSPHRAVWRETKIHQIWNHLLHKIRDVTSSPRHVTKMTEVMLVDQDFMTRMAAMVKKETEKSTDVESKREDRRRKLVEAPSVKRTGTWITAMIRRDES